MTETVPDIIFTISQEIGLSKFERFLKSPERIFLLKGKAGTGKTTIIKEALKSLLLEDKYSASSQRNVLGITVAHRAKEMLRGSIPYVNTFASVFGHREVPDGKGNMIFKLSKYAMQTADCTKKWKVVVFDECSMINAKMLKMIVDLLDSNTKIIFMGDRGQLPPIDEQEEYIVDETDKDSPVFDLELPNFCTHELMHRVRQTEGNPIIDLSDIIYEEIFGGQDIYKVMQAMKQAIIVDNCGFRSIMTPEMYDIFAEISLDNYMDTKLIAYRRNTVKGFNKYLRDYIHYEPSEQYIKGEIIYMNKSYFHNDGNFQYNVHNSSEHVIKEVEENEFDGIPVHMVKIKNDIWLPALQGPKDSISMKMYHDLLQELYTSKKFDEYHAFKDQTFADFSYGYCLTAYKAQGSTYTNSFISAKDIFSVKMISNKRKLQALYTAVTRARENVFFIN